MIWTKLPFLVLCTTMAKLSYAEILGEKAMFGFSTHEELLANARRFLQSDAAFGDLPAAQQCQIALAQSGFFEMQFIDYENFYDDNSVMEVAQTGAYKGAEDIKEYVGFATFGVSPYIAGVPLIDYADAQYLPVSYTKEECVLAVAVVNAVVMDPKTSAGHTYAHTLGSKLNYTVIDAQTIVVNKVDFHFPVSFLLSFFSENFNAPGTYAYFCSSVMKSRCPDIYEFNQCTTVDECIQDLKSLPFVEGSLASITGKSQGCRVLHASYAANNPNHCAHLSFSPKEDPNGQVKCQQDSGKTPEELFSSEEIAFFNNVGATTFGFDSSTQFNVTYYDVDMHDSQSTSAASTFGMKVSLLSSTFFYLASMGYQ